MTNSDKRPFAEMLGAVYELYNRPLSETILGMWWEALQPYDLAAVRGAFNRHAMNPDQGQFIPKPADIVREFGGTTADASMLAWSKVVGGIKKFGTHVSVAFDDPIIHRVVTDLGGWYWLGQQTEKEMPFVENRFRLAYRAWRQRGLVGSESVRYLFGYFELQNSAHYPEWVEKNPPRLIGNPLRAGALARGEVELVEGWEQQLVRISGGAALEHKR